MKQHLTIENYTDPDGNPTGGMAHGTGINISWQSGPLGRGADRVPPNGAFVEDVIGVAVQRLEHYQSSKFKCVENENAIAYLKTALMWLNKRTEEREARVAVQG